MGSFAIPSPYKDSTMQVNCRSPVFIKHFVRRNISKYSCKENVSGGGGEGNSGEQSVKMNHA